MAQDNSPSEQSPESSVEGVVDLSNALAAVTAAAGKSIVTVSGRRRLPASGVAWSEDGLIVTANHVVERDENITIITSTGEEVEAEVLGRDAAVDLVLLRSPANLEPGIWSRAEALQVGQLALAVARPLGAIQASLGILTAVGPAWQHPGGGRFDAYLQADVTMYPGFSGGPLVMADGTFAGLNSSALARGKSLAVPASNVEKSVSALLAHGHIPRAYLGVGVQPVQLEPRHTQNRDAHSALMVMSVEPDAPAAKAGILQGDILLALQQIELGSVEDLQYQLGEITQPAAVALSVLRGGVNQEFTAELTLR